MPTTTERSLSGDLQLPRVLVTSIAQVARQQILDGLGLWQGEWFLDQLAGFPWAQRVLGIKNPNVTQIQALLRQFLLSVANVVSVVASATFDVTRRAFSYTYTASLSNGQQLVGGSGQSPTITGSP
jgi:hypothetical protein